MRKGKKEKRPKKKKKAKVGPHIPSDPSLMGETRCLLGTQTEIQTQRDPVSPVEPLRLSTSGPGGRGEARGTGAKGRRESRKNTGRRGALEWSLHHDLQNIVSSIFFSYLTLGGGWGERHRKCDYGIWIQRGLMDTPDRPCPRGA